MTNRIICIFSDLLKSPKTVGISGLEYWCTWRVTILKSDFSFVILECNTGVYKTLTEHDRSVSYTGVVKCDNTLAHNWYRITGAAGSQIPIFSVERKHCGTNAPGWMIGDQPTVAEGAVARQVCYHGPITVVNILISSWLATALVSIFTFCQNHLVAICVTVVTEVRIHRVDSPDTQSFFLSTAQG